MLEISDIKAENKRQEFLDLFTEELIYNTALLIKERIKFEKELARAKKEIDIEKLRQKFSRYGEKPKIKQTIEEKPVTQAQPMIFRPAQRMIMPPQQRVLIKPAEAKPAAPSTAPLQIQKPAEQKKPKDMQITTIPIPPKQPPVNPGEINFEKLMFLVKDPTVTYIECPGINKNVIIKKVGMTLKTQIILGKDEILRIIKSFSETARIPLIEGLLTARIQNLEISAIVTEKGNSSFIIRKVLIEVKPLSPSMLAQPSMPGAVAMPESSRLKSMMPPVTRPFTPGAVPAQQAQQRFPQAQQKLQQANPEQKKESFWSRKITIGK